ncbi:cytochrome c-type biogenesis protein CcmH [Chloroflexota bacterium]
MKIKHKAFILVLVLLILIPVLAACSSTPVEESAVDNISNQLKCVCGCDDILSECDCETAQEQKDVIRRGLSRGQSEQEIIQGLISKYGERVLAK